MNFKRFTLLSLSAVVLAGGGFLLQKNKEVKYFPRNESSISAQSASGYLDYIQSIKANQVTGDINPIDVFTAQKQAQKMTRGKSSLAINWAFKGPDNVGGRSRAFIVDNTDSDHLLAGGVAGGVYESFDQGQTWNVYDSDFKVKNISCITQGADGSFYVGTGGHFEGGGAGGRGYFFLGSGLHKLTGNGTFETIVAPSNRLSGFTSWATIGNIAADPNDANIIYAAMNDGFRKIDMSGAEPVITDPIGNNQRANDVDISNDGKLIVAYQGGRIYTSHDNGKNFVMNSFPSRRTEIAIAPSNSNIIYASMTDAGSCLYGIFRSKNGGLSWDRISPASSPTFDMFNIGNGCQGFWDNAIAVYPDNPGRIIVGGVTLFRWEQSSVDPAPINGSWNQIDVLFDRLPGGGRIPFYVHSDKHRVVFDPKNFNIAYIASDGGISKSTNIESTTPVYNTFNFNFRVTQFYGIGVNPNDLVVGGTQDNSGHLLGLKFNNNLGSITVFDGFDGFDADMSTINPSLAFVTAQNGRVRRLQGIGTTPSNSNLSEADITSNNAFLGGLCATPEGCNRVFYTATKLWESFDHKGSKDVVGLQETEFTIPPLASGRVYKYESNNSSVVRRVYQEFEVLAADTNSHDTILAKIDTSIYTLVGKDFLIIPDDTLIGSGADAAITKNITEFTNLTLVANYDTITIDTAAKVVTINHPNGTIENLPYTLGTTVPYNNEFYGSSVSFRVSERTVDGSKITEFTYWDIQISFYYDLKFPDHVQTIFALPNWPGSGANYAERNLFITRDAIKSTTNIRWYCVAGAKSSPHPIGNGDDVISMEFSNDGNYLFFGTQGGSLYRLSDLDSLTNNEPITEDGVNLYRYQQGIFAGKCHRIGRFSGRAVTDIAIDPNNTDNIVVSLGNYGNGNFVARTTIATTAMDFSGTFSWVQGIGSGQLPKAPAYTVLFDMTDTLGSRLYLGSELGVFVTEDVFENTQVSDTVITPADTLVKNTDTVSVVNNSIHNFIDSLITPLDSFVVVNDTVVYFPADTMFIVGLKTPDTTITLGRTDISIGSDVKWTEESIGMGRVPVFDLEQMTFPWPYSNFTGKIYAGTHGRGVYELSNFVGIGDVKHHEYKDGFKSSLKFYPNPVRDNAKIEFNLAERGSVQVQVFNIRGKLVKSEQLNSLNKGMNTVDLSLNELVNGTYIIRVINGSEVATNKFVLYK